MNNAVDFQKLLKTTKAWMHFEDGKSFFGFINLKKDDKRIKRGLWGEAAFTTGMSGYQETMTDPSFLGQHIIFSSAHIGNYPSDPQVSQSSKIHATCLVARNFSANELLLKTETPLFLCEDTRELVKYLVNSKASHKSVISTEEKPPSKEEFKNATLFCNDLTRVGQEQKEVIVEGDNPIVLVNYGNKTAILNHLKSMKLPLVTVPSTTSCEEISKLNPRLIFLSNGPGDPRSMDLQIREVEKMLELNIPMRGICLGHQLLTLALGAKVIRLPFGQRGMNHPCFDTVTGEILITSQNHGYASEEQSLKNIAQNNPLKRELFISYKSMFDGSVEGMATNDHFLKTVQFHPEAHPGPLDASTFFVEIEKFLKEETLPPIDTKKLHVLPDLKKSTKKENTYKKILIIGSGPIKIGQASEFDYSGTQACKSLMDLGVKVVLLNSNPATIMTDPEMAYKTYIEPITKETIKKIIQREKVDAVLSTMGGQTALNICVELEEEHFLKNSGVALLGANVDTIKKTEDRDLFSQELATLGYQTGKRFKAQNETEAELMAKSRVGYPLIIRRDFALGGKGAALVKNQEELNEVFKSDIQFPITMEKSLLGWKEIELEVMVDKNKNGVIICSIENIDPCGIHTGDSITVAPAQTISDRCYQKLRSISLHVAKHMGVVAGGANVQFAINPHDEDDIVVIEMNPRVSRSSALASKATGYPIAKISALLAVGYTLVEILNDITKASPVAFEPTLDYVAIKIPIFPFNKFPTSSKILGPQMRSVGEVLALGGSFNEAFLKALRSLEIGLEIPSISQIKNIPMNLSVEFLEKRLKSPFQLSLLTCLDALRNGLSVEKIHNYTQISKWFIEQVSLIHHAEKEIQNNHKLLEDKEIFRSYKKLGLSDKHLALLSNKSQKDILAFRFKENIFPVYKAVDTCSGEFNALTPYFYSTYNNFNEAESLSSQGPSIAILGSGPNRIGQGIEFDYSCVKSCQHLRSKGIQAIMINSNPETVSTDYDSSNRLYLSPLFSEDLFDILINENPKGVIASFSGQTGISIREHIESSFRSEFRTFDFLGPTLESINLTEDRNLFSQMCKEVDLSQTNSLEIRGHKNMVNALTEIGLPVIIRPSFVIGGESMYIFNHHDDLGKLPPETKEQLENSTTTFQVENYLKHAIEYDVDLIRDNFGNSIFTVCEHIEHAGVHSGDSGMISPPVFLTDGLYKKMKEISIKLSEKLNIVGPINFQYAVQNGQIYCIEANPRGSRTLPFLSKAYNISLPSLATEAMIGKKIPNWDREYADYFCVKQSTFPFDRFIQDNIILGPKMRSTGETMGIDSDKEKAVMKSYLGNYPKLNKKGMILISLADHNKEVIIPYIKPLRQMGYEFAATSGTWSFIRKQGIPCQKVAKIEEEGQDPTILQILNHEKIRMVFNTPRDNGSSKSDGEVIRNTAIAYGIPTFTRRENIRSTMEAIIGSHDQQNGELIPLSLQEMHDIHGPEKNEQINRSERQSIQ